jgi:hypothetical protein
VSFFWSIVLTTDCGRLILTYLIPCRLITQHVVPKAPLLAASPRLERIFGPLVACIRKGDLTGFDKALAEGEPEFVKRRIFLTLERSRDIALRNLLRRVYLAGGYDELKEGQPLVNFAVALRMGGQVVEDDEVECLLANQIYKVRLHNQAQSSLLHHLQHYCGFAGFICKSILWRQHCFLSHCIWLSLPSANAILGSDEGIHLARACHGSLEQEGRFPWHRMLKLPCTNYERTSYRKAYTYTYPTDAGHKRKISVVSLHLSRHPTQPSKPRYKPTTPLVSTAAAITADMKDRNMRTSNLHFQ